MNQNRFNHISIITYYFFFWLDEELCIIIPDLKGNITMQTMQFISQIGQDGLLHLPLPDIWKGIEVEVLVVWQLLLLLNMNKY